MSRAATGILLIVIGLALGACGGAEDVGGITEPGGSQTVASESPSTSPPTTDQSAPSATNPTATTDQTTAPSTTTPPSTNSETVVSSTTQPPQEAADPPPTEEVVPAEPTTTAPDTAVPPGFESWVAAARSDLASRLGVDAAQIGIAVAESIVWPDAGLGCPQPGMAYAQVQVEGFRIVLEHDGASHAYHGGGNRPQPFLCEKPSFP